MSLEYGKKTPMIIPGDHERIIVEKTKELARTYRAEMLALQDRVNGLCRGIEDLKEEEIASNMGVGIPKMGNLSGTWLEGPLRNAKEAAIAIQALNLVKVNSWEEIENDKRRA